MAQKQDLNFDEEDDLSYTLTITDSNGDAVDLTDSTFYMTCKKKKSDPDANAIFKKTVTSIPLATSGIVTIAIDGADTAGKTAGVFPYDIVWVSSTTKKRTVMEGLFNLTEAITKDI